MKPRTTPEPEETISKVSSLAFALCLMAALMYLLLTRQWVAYAFAAVNITGLVVLSYLIVREVVRNLFKKD